MTKKILMIAFQYPPMVGSSAIQRALKFSHYLPAHGWDPVVLSAHPRAYERTSDEQMPEIPSQVEVHRAFALDVAKHLSINGRYPSWFALPDRWVPWALGAVWSGLRLIRTHRPQVLWSTYPIATTHLIGLCLQRLTGLPWVADFRDPMAQVGYPADPTIWRSFKWIEGQTLKHCSRAVFVTRGTLRMYSERYAEIDANKLKLISNGYDEENFGQAANVAQASPPRSGGLIKLLHSGIIYPSERDPRDFFAALAELKAEGHLSREQLSITLRQPGDEAYIGKLLRDFDIESIVNVAPGVSHQEALAEMLTTDALLVLQGSNCNDQIPAKVYEYFRAGRPILGLTDPLGDTAAELRAAGIDTIAPLNSKTAIKEAFLKFLALLRDKRAPIADDAFALSNSRVAKTAELAALLDQIIEHEKSSSKGIAL